MVEVRTLRSEDYPAAILLADKVFKGNENRMSMGDEFRTAFSPEFGQSYGAFVDGRIVSFVGLVPHIIHIGKAELQTYSMGAVCTDPEYRGQGYASRIIDRIIQHMNEAHAALLLVSGGRGLYARIGCERFGQCFKYEFHANDFESIADPGESDSPFRMREFQAEDWFKLRKLARDRAVRYEHSLWDLATLIHANVPAANDLCHNRIVVAENKQDGTLAGFLMTSYPDAPKESFTMEAIEYAGSPYVMMRLVASAFRIYRCAGQNIHVPWQEAELIREFDAARPSAKKNIRNEGTVMIIDPERLISQLRPYLESRSESISHGFHVSGREGEVELSLRDRTLKLSPKEFTALVFDGHIPEATDPGLREEMEVLFPIPFPYTAGMNYV